MASIADLMGRSIRAQELLTLHPGRCPICHGGDAWYEAHEISTYADREPVYVLSGTARCRTGHAWKPDG